MALVFLQMMSPGGAHSRVGLRRPSFRIFLGLVLQGQLLSAVEFVLRHRDCLFDVALLSTVSEYARPPPSPSLPHL